MGEDDVNLDDFLALPENTPSYLGYKPNFEEMTDCIVSFSGGETSAYMAIKLKEKYPDTNFHCVFANTSLEHEKTYEFVQKVSDAYELNVIWVEANVNHGGRGKGYGTTHTVTDFHQAKRNGEIFEQVIKKFGIPNTAFKSCSRELKKRAITSWARTASFQKAPHCLGMRVDEIDRVGKQAKDLQIWYPLIDTFPTKKEQINKFWDAHPWRLEIESYLGNCVTCWKKSDKKLAKIAAHFPEAFDFFAEMERKYTTRPQKGFQGHTDNSPECRFFRGGRLVSDILRTAQDYDTDSVFDGRMLGLMPTKHVQTEIDFGDCGDGACTGW